MARMWSRLTVLNALTKSILSSVLGSSAPHDDTSRRAACVIASPPPATLTPICPTSSSSLAMSILTSPIRNLPEQRRKTSPHAIGRMPPPFFARATPRAPKTTGCASAGVRPLLRNKMCSPITL